MKWDKLRARYISGEWATLEEMAEAEGLSTSTVYKHTAGWKEKRQDLAEEGSAMADTLIVQDLAEAKREAHARHLTDAKLLYIKAMNYLLGKVRNKHGELVEREFESEGAALATARLAIAVEQGLLFKEPAQAGGSTNNFLMVGAPNQLAQVKAQLRELSAVDLRHIIDHKDGHGPSGPKKISGRGDAAEDGGAGKRR